ncbi:hypothetical protein [Cytobacillus sp. FSL R5-0596]|uniref:hypothetical protein n=1 Tax=Cytobacillus sp. FSL R5-0596 TaxID=2954696 RepID=UPI0030F64C94
MNEKRYRAKINGLYITSASVFSGYIDLRISDYSQPRYLTEKEKDFVLTYFPDAVIKSYSLVEEGEF